MIRVEIEPVWHFRKDDGPEGIAVVLTLLGEIRASGRITRAADQAAMSYRHAWNLIEKWSAFFGTPLVERHRGRGSFLTPFGDKLVWAGQRLRARLGPQLENLSQELETELNGLLPHRPAVVRVHASHGFAVSTLREMLNHEQAFEVDLRYVSNQNSLVSLARNDCELAGMHLPQGRLRQASIAASRPWLVPSLHRVVSFVTREMGLMVKRGNPLAVAGLDSLCRPAVRFVNRDPDSGTRILFDQLLTQHGLRSDAINGYARIEFTHAAVAAYVASGMADVAFGVEAAARQFDLDFVRLVTEDYFFVCRKETLGLDPVKRVLTVMRSDAFHAAIAKLPGYKIRDAGAVTTIGDMFRLPQ